MVVVAPLADRTGVRFAAISIPHEAQRALSDHLTEWRIPEKAHVGTMS
jgi:hypothetical protein